MQKVTKLLRIEYYDYPWGKNMSLEAINELLVPISTSITLIVTAIGVWLSLKEYRLKVKAETRLAESAEIESDVKLLNLFSETMEIAHARGGYKVSEKAMEKILTPEFIKKLGGNVDLRDLIEYAIVSLPVGIAQQNAAICAIWMLGKKHPTLAPIAIQGLETLNSFKGDVVQDYLNDLKNDFPNSLPKK